MEKSRRDLHPEEDKRLKEEEAISFVVILMVKNIYYVIKISIHNIHVIKFHNNLFAIVYWISRLI